MSQYLPVNPSIESDLLTAYKNALKNDNLAISESGTTKSLDNSVQYSIDDIYGKILVEKAVASYNDIKRGEGVSLTGALIRSGYEDDGVGVSGDSSFYNNPSYAVTVDGFIFFDKNTVLVFKRENNYSGVMVARLNSDYSFSVTQNINVAESSQIKSIIKIARDKVAVFYNTSSAVTVKIYEVYDYELTLLSETVLLDYDYTEINFIEVVLNKVMIIYKDVLDDNNVKGFFVCVNQDDSVTKSVESVIFTENNKIVYMNDSDGGKLYLKNLSIEGNGTAITSVYSTFPCYVGNNKIVYMNYSDGKKLYLKDLSIEGNGTAITSVYSYYPCYVGNNKIVYTNNNDGYKLYLKDLSIEGNGTAITSVVGYCPCYVGDNKIVYTNYSDDQKLYLKDLSIEGNGTAITSVSSYHPCYVGNNKIVYTNNNDGGKLYLKDLSIEGNGTAITSVYSYFPCYVGNNKIVYTNNNDGYKLYLKDLSIEGNGTAITSVVSYYPCYVGRGYTIKSVKKIDAYKTVLLCETLLTGLFADYKAVYITSDINDNITVGADIKDLERPTLLQDNTVGKFLMVKYLETVDAQTPNVLIVDDNLTALSDTTLPSAIYANLRLFAMINNKNILFYSRSGNIYYRYLTRNTDDSVTIGDETLLSAIAEPYYIDFTKNNAEGIFVFYNYNANTIYNYKSIIKKNVASDIIGIALNNGKEDDIVKVQASGVCNIFKNTLITGQKYYIDKFGNITTDTTGKFIGYALSSKDLLIINEAMLLKNDKGLLKSENLNDLSNKATARTNLDVYSKGEVDTKDTNTLNGAKSYTDGQIANHDSQHDDRFYLKSEVDGKDNTKIAKTTYVETIDDTGIEDGMVVVFDKTNKKLKKLGNVKIDSNGHFLSKSSSTSNKIGIGCAKTSGSSSFLMSEIKTQYIGAGWKDGCVILSHPSSTPHETPPVDFVYLYQGGMGLGKYPDYQLDLSTDNARKLTTSTWITGSDERLKDNIELADLTRCYEIVKNLPLKRFKWKYYDNQVNDLNALGWIAQDVKKIFPKAITENEIEIIPEKKEIIKDAVIDKNGNVIKEAEYKIIQERQVLKDGLLLNSDQINKVLYGAVQNLIEKEESQQREIDDLKARLEKLEAIMYK